MLCSTKSPRELAWLEMKKRVVFSVVEIAQVTPMTRRQVSTFVSRLLDKQVVELVQKNGRTYKYQLKAGANIDFGKGKASSSPKSLPPSRPRHRMWTSMRVLRKFNICDIQTAGEVKRSAANKFINILVKAGYLRKLSPGSPTGEKAMYLMVKNTGPKAPIERQNKGLWDPNLSKFVSYKEVK